jgi:hypothetical protein
MGIHGRDDLGNGREGGGQQEVAENIVISEMS